MKNGFIKVAAATPKIRVADPGYNTDELIRMSQNAAGAGIRVLVFPELCITGYTCGDLFFSQALLSGAVAELSRYLHSTASLELISVVGLPLIWKNKLYNCAAVCHRGAVLGIVPKTHIPGYGELGETRYFAEASELTPHATLTINGAEAPFGTDLLFTCREMPALRLAVEIGEDLEGTLPISSRHTAAGATLICCPAASCETVGREAYRFELIRSQSARSICGYLYAGAGEGESTTDVVFGGHDLICENGTVLTEKKPFESGCEMVCTELDTERLCYERRRISIFPQNTDTDYREIGFSLPEEETSLTRFIDPHPFIPSDAAERAQRCERILTIQANGLKQRVERAFAKKLVLGISGGLDSTLALLVMVRAMDALGRPRKDIIAVTMPCFGTTVRTKTNATVLCEELGVDFRCVDIFDAVNQHFHDIGHDPADRNVTYENSQARERTQILMDIANDCGGMVVGTGDLSELALGWATYNGDHMSMYAVNASVPKTLIRHIVSYCADCYEKTGSQKLADSLRDILGTPVSPELLPADEKGEIAQKTEDLVGPYEIHDFYLYYMLRFGFTPVKLYRLAQAALGDTYDNATLLKWLKTFVRRVFSQQFKRSCSPDGPKVGSVTLSPRGDWRMPSDASCALWLKELEEL